MTHLPPPCLEDMQSLLDSIHPEKVLVLYAADLDKPDTLPEMPGTISLEPFTADGLPESLQHYQIYDVVILIGVETLARKRAMQIISRIRDFHAHHFLLLIDRATLRNQADWQSNDFIGMGLRIFNRYPEDGDLIVYRFELSDYKTTPEWLNSRYWANPELYGKYRW